MGPHEWLFPWLAIAAGAIALIAALYAGRVSFRESPVANVPRGFLFVWAIVLLLGIFATVKLSTVTGGRWVASRGLVLGAISGAVAALICRRGANDNFWAGAALIGLVTMTVAIGSLWLGYGEISGMMSIAMGMALSLLCFGIAPAALVNGSTDPAAFGSGRGVAALLYLVTLVAGVDLGFSKADDISQRYWADIPLLIGGAISLLVVIAAAIARGGFSKPAPPMTLVAGGTLACAFLIASQAGSEWRIPAMAGAGAIVALIGFGLNRTALTGPTARLGGFAAVVLAVLGAILCFQYWSGYGMALFFLGMWAMAGAPVMANRAGASAPNLIGLGFGAALLIYRLALLQSGSTVRATGPGDIWDLFAIALGAILPCIVAEWVRFESMDRLFPRALVLVEWLAALIAPAVLLEYVWQPRSLAGVYLGVALGLLLAGRETGDPAARPSAVGLDKVTLGGIMVSLVMFQFLPLMANIDTPTREIRIGAILILAALLLVRLFLPARPAPAAAAAKPAEA